MSSIDPDQLCSSTSDLIGFAGDPDNGTIMKGNGTDPLVIVPKLEALRSTLQKARDTRDKAKSTYQLAQRAFEKSAEENYHIFSNSIDTVSGALGKETPQGKIVLGYRKHVTGSDKHHHVTPPPTPPGATTTTTNPPPAPPGP